MVYALWAYVILMTTLFVLEEGVKYVISIMHLIHYLISTTQTNTLLRCLLGACLFADGLVNRKPILLLSEQLVIIVKASQYRV